MDDVRDEFRQTHEAIVRCKLCALNESRIRPVIGQGSYSADIIFIGEAPGANEDKTGTPFCGRAGDVLNELLDSIGIKRENVYIANILKCRPPKNRDPQISEIRACVPHLERQIELIRPQIICTLGNYATKFILGKYQLTHHIQGISKIHGKSFIADGGLIIIPLYHPAATIYNPNLKETLKEDFKIMKNLLK